MSPQLPTGLSRVAEVSYVNQVVYGESAGGKDGTLCLPTDASAHSPAPSPTHWSLRPLTGPSTHSPAPSPTHWSLCPLTGPSAYQQTSPPLTSPSVCHHSLLRWVEPARTQVGPTEQSGHRVGGILRPHLHCVGEREEEGLAGEATHHSTQHSDVH